MPSFLVFLCMRLMGLQRDASVFLVQGIAVLRYLRRGFEHGR